MVIMAMFKVNQQHYCVYHWRSLNGVIASSLWMHRTLSFGMYTQSQQSMIDTFSRWPDDCILCNSRLMLPIELVTKPVAIIEGTMGVLPSTNLTRACPYNMTLTVASTYRSQYIRFNSDLSASSISVNISGGQVGQFPLSDTPFLLPFGSPLDTAFTVTASGPCVDAGLIPANITSPWVLATTSVFGLVGVPQVLTAGDSVNITMNIGSVPLLVSSLVVTVQLAWIGTQQDVNLNGRPTAASLVYTWDSSTTVTTLPPLINITLNCASFLRQTDNTFVNASINVTSVVVSTFALRYYRVPVRIYPFQVYKPLSTPIVPAVAEPIGQVVTVAGTGVNGSTTLQSVGTLGARGLTAISATNGLFCPNETTYCLFGDIKDGSIKMLDLADGNEGYVTSYTSSGLFYDIGWILQVPRGIVPAGTAGTALNVAADSDSTYYLAGDTCAIWLLKHPSTGSIGRNGTVVQMSLYMGVHQQVCPVATSTADGSIAAKNIGFVRSTAACIGERDNLLYIVDSQSHTVRLIDIVAGTIARYAGGTYGSAGATNGARVGGALFRSPRGIVFNGDRAGTPTLYVTDFQTGVGDGLIRAITTVAGQVTTFAGLAGAVYGNGAATAVTLLQPVGIAFDPVNSIIYFAEQLGGRIRQVKAGQVTTLAGPPVITVLGSQGYNGDQKWGNATLFNLPGYISKWRDHVIFVDVNNYQIRRVAIPIELKTIGIFGMTQGGSSILAPTSLTRACPYPVQLTITSTQSRVIFLPDFVAIRTDSVIPSGSLGSTSPYLFTLPGGLDATALCWVVTAAGACVDQGYMNPNLTPPWIISTSVLPIVSINGAPTYMTNGDIRNVTLDIDSVPVLGTSLTVTVQLSGAPTTGDINLNGQSSSAILTYTWDSTSTISTQSPTINITMTVTPWLRLNANSTLAVSLNLLSVVSSTIAAYRSPVRAYPFTVYRPSFSPVLTTDTIGTVTTLAGTGVNAAITSVAVQTLYRTGLRGTASLSYTSGLFCPNDQTFCLIGDTNDQSIRKMGLTSGNEGEIATYSSSGSFTANQWTVQPASGVIPSGTTGITSTTTYYLAGSRCGIYVVRPPTSSNETATSTLWMGVNGIACPVNAIADGSVSSGTIRFGNPVAATIGESPEILYVVDGVALAIRRINITAGTIERYAGGIDGYGVNSGYVNGDRLTSALFSAIKGITYNGDVATPTLYITDDQYIRAIAIKTGIVSTFAGGLAETGSSGDGITTAVRLYQPLGITCDQANQIIYFTEVTGARVRQIKNGVVTTLAGSMTQQSGFNGDGNGLSVLFNSPDQIAKWRDQLIITDIRNFMVRRIVIPIELD
jgi:hypothetical protein